MRWNTTHPSTLWAILLLQLSYCIVGNLVVSQTVHLFFNPYSCLYGQPWMGSRRILKGARCSIRWIGGHFAKRGARSRWMCLLSEEDVDCCWWWTKTKTKTKIMDQNGGPLLIRLERFLEFCKFQRLSIWRYLLLLLLCHEWLLHSLNLAQMNE